MIYNSRNYNVSNNMIFDAFAMFYIKYYILAQFCKVHEISDNKFLYTLDMSVIKKIFSQTNTSNTTDATQKEVLQASTLRELAVYLYAYSDYNIKSYIVE